MEELLNQITMFADHAHGEQTRKYTPERYIVHPVRVMKICKEYSSDITLLAAALLHDVLEDTPVGKEEMKAFLLKVMGKDEALKTLQQVEELTDVYIRNRYPLWNRRKRKTKEAERMENISPGAQTVKYADIIDNSLEVIHHDIPFAKLYLSECKALLIRINRGDSRLYKRAIETVDMCLEQTGNGRKTNR